MNEELELEKEQTEIIETVEITDTIETVATVAETDTVAEMETVNTVEVIDTVESVAETDTVAEIETENTVEMIDTVEAVAETDTVAEIETVDTVEMIDTVETVEETDTVEEIETVEIVNTVEKTVETTAKNSAFENAKKQFAKDNNADEFLDSDYKWYCIRTYTGHEERIKQTIEAEIKRLGLQSVIREIVIPLETVFEVRNGKRKTKIRNFLPGYIVIKAVISEEKKTKNKILDIVGGITGVIAFVGRKNNPTPLQESEVERIFGRVAERAGIETIDCTYQKGDPIKIIDGPFAGFSGSMMEVNNEKQKAKVELIILGRKTPVELDFTQIQFDRPE